MLEAGPTKRSATLNGAKSNQTNIQKFSIPIIGIIAVFVIWILWGIYGAPAIRACIEGQYLSKYSIDNKSNSQKSSTSSTLADGTKTACTAAPIVENESGENQATDAHKISDYFAQLGQTGDLFGGVNALFAAMALVGVFWAASMQWKTMTENRQAIAEQQFETAFFELLRLTREVSERIEDRNPRIVTSNSKSDPERISKGITRTGAAALDSLAFRTFSDSPSIATSATGEDLRAFNLGKLVALYKSKIYQPNPSALGPYFRLLYQTFDLVAHAPLIESQKIRYANIARGQIGDGAVFLLALNGLTWRGFNFVELIERFGLLEHMHQRYLKPYRKLLLVAYRPNAFRGSQDRAKNLSDPQPYPGPRAFDRDPTQPDFEITAPPSDWTDMAE